MLPIRADRRFRRLLPAAAVAALLCGCASVPTPPPWQDKLAATGWSVGAEVSSVPNFMFSGFSALDETHFVIHVGTTRRVLVTTSGSCLGLDDALRIAYRHHDSELARLDTVHIHPPGELPTSCVVEQINQLVAPRA